MIEKDKGLQRLISSQGADHDLTSRLDQIREKYERLASFYDPVLCMLEVLGLGRLRRRLLSQASGEVLEVAAGTGRNFDFNPKIQTYTALDLTPGMLGRARRRATEMALEVRFVRGDAGRLPFADRTFDTVIDALTVCTFPDPVRALMEMRRVCRPGGSIVLLEHGVSDRDWLARLQNRGAEAHYRQFCCRWNLRPPEILRAAGLSVRSCQRTLLGLLYLIQARP